MKSQGLPIHIGHGTADLRALEVAPYARTGGKAAFLHLHGMQGITGGYIGEIPPGAALKPERHLKLKATRALGSPLRFVSRDCYLDGSCFMLDYKSWFSVVGK
jgi:hypothetical protein